MFCWCSAQIVRPYFVMSSCNQNQYQYLMFTSLSLTQEWIFLSTSFSPLSHLFESTSNIFFFECAQRRTINMFGDFSESLQEFHYLWRRISSFRHSASSFQTIFWKSLTLLLFVMCQLMTQLFRTLWKYFSSKSFFYWGWKCYFLNQQASDEMMTVTLKRQ